MARETPFKDIRDILAASKENATLTSIKEATGFNSKKAEYYIDVLKRVNMLEERNGMYFPTPGGIRFVQQFDNGFKDSGYIV